jgi:hypothetical protein
MHLSRAIEAPLPEDEDNRVRTIRYWDPVTTGVARMTYYDYESLRSRLSTFETLAAFRSAAYTLGPEGDRADPVTAAEVTASTFEILVAQTPHTVIGIMPPEFLFPTAHQVWLPLREERAVSPDEGRDLLIMGRLADGVSADEAPAEVTALPAPAEASEERSRLQLRVVPFGLRASSHGDRFCRVALPCSFPRVRCSRRYAGRSRPGSGTERRSEQLSSPCGQTKP